MHFFSLSPEIQPRFWLLLVNLCPLGIKIFFCFGQAVFCLLSGCFLSTGLRAGFWFRRKEYLPSLNSQALLELLSKSYWHIWLFFCVCFQSFGCCWSLNYRNTTCTERKKKNRKKKAPCSQCFLPQVRSACPDLPSQQWNLGNHPWESISLGFLGSPSSCKLGISRWYPSKKAASFPMRELGCLSQIIKAGPGSVRASVGNVRWRWKYEYGYKHTSLFWISSLPRQLQGRGMDK